MNQKRIIHGELATGEELFCSHNIPLKFSVSDFWSFQFSNFWNMNDDVSEFLVAKALNNSKPTNREAWTLYDIRYNDCRIEVKSSSDFHCWTKPGSKPSKCRFSIEKAHCVYKDISSPLERQNDLYVFCHNMGTDFESSYPLDTDNWEFYVVLTTEINRRFKNQKSVSLNMLKRFFKPVEYSSLKKEIDECINNMR